MQICNHAEIFSVEDWRTSRSNSENLRQNMKFSQIRQFTFQYRDRTFFETGISRSKLLWKRRMQFDNSADCSFHSILTNSGASYAIGIFSNKNANGARDKQNAVVNKTELFFSRIK